MLVLGFDSIQATSFETSESDEDSTINEESIRSSDIETSDDSVEDEAHNDVYDSIDDKEVDQVETQAIKKTKTYHTRLAMPNTYISSSTSTSAKNYWDPVTR